MTHLTKAGLFLLVCPTAALASEVPVVPEPSSILLMAGGLGALILLARRRRNR